jgi:hypothetical protein
VKRSGCFKCWNGKRETKEFLKRNEELLLRVEGAVHKQFNE